MATDACASGAVHPLACTCTRVLLAALPRVERVSAPDPFGTAFGTYTRACVVCPIGMLAITLLLTVSIAAAMFPFSRATYTLEPSPDGQIPCGRLPTGIVATSSGFGPLRNAFTSFAPPIVT